MVEMVVVGLKVALVVADVEVVRVSWISVGRLVVQWCLKMRINTIVCLTKRR